MFGTAVSTKMVLFVVLFMKVMSGGLEGIIVIMIIVVVIIHIFTDMQTIPSPACLNLPEFLQLLLQHVGCASTAIWQSCEKITFSFERVSYEDSFKYLKLLFIW